MKLSTLFRGLLVLGNSRYLFRTDSQVSRAIRVPARTVIVMRNVQGRVIAHRHVAKTPSDGRWYSRESQAKHFSLSISTIASRMRLKIHALSLIARRGVMYALMSCQFDYILSLVSAVILLVSHIVLHCTPRMVRPIDDA
jgi:hypothetical protein